MQLHPFWSGVNPWCGNLTSGLSGATQPREDDLYTSARPKAGLVDPKARLRHLKGLCYVASRA